MNTKFFKHAAIALLLAGSFSSCANKMNNDPDPEKAILGKWKLVKTNNPMSGQSFDYSRYNIVYEFNADKVLIISGETETFMFPEIGEYSYSFINDENGYGMVGLPYGLEIGIRVFWYRISSKEMEISQAPLDGGIYYFVKD